MRAIWRPPKIPSLKTRRTQKLCHLFKKVTEFPDAPIILQGGFHTKAEQLTSIPSQSHGQELHCTKLLLSKCPNPLE
jgi:hypothetical protein